MRSLAALLVAAAVARAELPLGPYFRPGVPVLRAGRLEEPDATQKAVPPGALVAAVVGDAPADLEARLRAQAGADVIVVPIDPAGVNARHWPALDVFDRIYSFGRPVAPVVRSWVLAGGSLALVGAEWAGATGLGTVTLAPDAARALETAGPVQPARIPRVGAARPDVYDLVRPPAGPTRALRTARRIVWGAAAALAVQIVLAALGVLAGRRFRLLLGAVVVAGAGVGWTSGRADYTPVAHGRIEVSFFGGGFERRRTYLVYTSAGPGAEVPPGGRPVAWRAGGPPWTVALEPGVIRIFVEEDVVAGEPRLTGAGGVPALSLLAREAPLPGTIRGNASAGLGRLAAEPGAPPVVARLEIVVQD